MSLNSKTVSYHVQALMLFLNISKDTRSLTSDFVEKALMRCAEILNITNKNPEEGAHRLNSLIEEMNQYLNAPYPHLIMDSLENLVKGEIAAFEHFLNQELKANNLSIYEEAPLFNDSLHLWESIGSTLSAEEGISEFNLIIGKANALLPDEQHYPLHDET